MDLVPCNDDCRQSLIHILFAADESGLFDEKQADYVARTFPSILLDIAHQLTEQSTKKARELTDPSEIVKQQLKPFFMFNFLLGKCPQVTSLMYSYFENSLFMPLPGELFTRDDNTVVYAHPGFNDEVLKQTLLNYLRYLAFNPKWFSAVWDWSELGRILSSHTDVTVRYLACCCLSIITRPSRSQYVSFMRDVFTSNDHQSFINLSIKHRHIFTNAFKPCIEAKKEKVDQFVMHHGGYQAEYSYSSDSIVKVVNVLLLKKELEPNCSEKTKRDLENVMKNFVPIAKLEDTISRIAYSISIGKPCFLRGPSGSGKTSILEYVAALTNRINPPEFVKIQIGDQLDSKLLLGSYVSTEIPGQFEWQPGPLTQGMINGSWIVFEDIDSAPPDLAQVIHSVIDGGGLSSLACCPIRMDNIHPDFRLFFTQKTDKQGAGGSFMVGFGFIQKLCDIVEMPSLEDDLEAIISARYNFGSLIPLVLGLYRTVVDSLILTDRTCRPINLRDLFKFCGRLSSRNFLSCQGKFQSADLELIFLDVVDCFISHLPFQQREDQAVKVGNHMNLSHQDVERLMRKRLPEVKLNPEYMIIGRVRLSLSSGFSLRKPPNLALTMQTARTLECIAQSLRYNEPVLLVGETGVGKTSIVQYLADAMRSELVVINLSQQSDSSDLLGGFKPIDLKEVMRPFHDKFEDLFLKTFDRDSILKYKSQITEVFTAARESGKWSNYLGLVGHLCGRAMKNGKFISKENLDGWKYLNAKAGRILAKITSDDQNSAMALAFSEGSLLKAIKDGHWIMLDEINLAEPEVLQCLISALDSVKRGQLFVHSSGAVGNDIKIHKNFRVFACMNPSTDVGKRDLSDGVRGRFTEFYIDDVLEKAEVRKIVESYVKTFLTTKQIEQIVEFYLEVRARTFSLNDVSGNSPIYSLRTLCRALSICSNNVCRHMERSLYESLMITFLQQLDEISTCQVIRLMEDIVFSKDIGEQFSKTPNAEPKDDGHLYKCVEGFYVQTSNQTPEIDRKYVLTDSVRRNLRNLARILSLSQCKLPILIQGKTSVGKTSLITYLAKLTGNKCYRINNHEHTDLQEYVGKYVLEENGELRFKEGLLVHAIRKGYWIILDELNLAPCELLEALNRVLDDNREIYIPETRQSIKAHAKFVLFATQNPPQEYAGRKMLSRAFRNRFIELHFDEVPGNELEEILHKRCEMAPQHSRKIVEVMRRLQCMRRESGCFNGKDSFMTMRDLFRWGERYAKFKKRFPDDKFYDWDQHLAQEGLLLLEGRVRTSNEADIVKNVIEEVFKSKLDRDKIYFKKRLDPKKFSANFNHIHFSPEFQKLFTQLSTALHYGEPVLLCGQTGCGKTTACQLYADLKKQELITYNCHLNTESSDFIGSVRPSRQEFDDQEAKQMFPWVDGPLLEAMKKGGVFMMDEISLADDAVIERLNSVLEPERSITLTEKEGDEIFANSHFRLVATMNPGGDYGKKELSPALRNRFTEIYCHNTTRMEHVRKIIEGSLQQHLLQPKVTPHLLSIMQKFLQDYYKGFSIVSVRDVLSWSKFLNKTTRTAQPRPLSVQEALLEGASLVYFDQFGTCGHMNANYAIKDDDMNKLKMSLKTSVLEKFGEEPLFAERLPGCLEINQDLVKFNKYYLIKGPLPIYDSFQKEFVLDANIVRKNLIKIVRAMQLDRPILLEGDPGAGKTSVIAALAKLTGNRLVRINLSEQTDISDLFGSDLPSSEESHAEKPKFTWCDGPLLRAIKESDWILLDEMNLASQSVLEGLNACLDHRGEVYIPELNKRITVDRTTTRIFACQNPYNQGAARRGLPQSFLNRFTSIYIKAHSSDDLEVIIKNLYPELSDDLIGKLIKFNSRVSAMYVSSGYEFNLRDILYWCELLTEHVGKDELAKDHIKADKFVQFSYLDRIRDTKQRTEISEIFKEIFMTPVYDLPYRDIKLGENSFVLGRAVLPRKTRLPPHLSELSILKYQLPYLESLAKSIQLKKMPILVGETGVGKRSIVRILAGLTGNELKTVGANSEMDTVELLGSFEQRSLHREVYELIERSKNCVSSILNSLSSEQYTNEWNQLFRHTWGTLYATSLRTLKTSGTDAIAIFRYQLTQTIELIDRVNCLTRSNIKDESECNELLRKLNVLSKRIDDLGESVFVSGSFQWIDSLLVTAIKSGSWVMIENANLLNPATLDRLNSLVEPKGSLILNEKGFGDRGVEAITPHPDFRLILTMDPRHGELSRAMRNRGAEIFMQTSFFFEDFLMMLDQNGFEPEEGKACMTYCIMQTSHDAHQKITGDDPAENGGPLAYFGLNYISTLTHQVRRGLDVEKILSDLLLSYYAQKGFLKPENEEETREFIMEKMQIYKKEYIVKFGDERYKWRHFKHNLMTLTGGDALPAMIERDHLIFYDDSNINSLLRYDEIVDNVDIVNTSIAIKIFLELASHGDLEYRRRFVREIYQDFPEMTIIVNKCVDQLLSHFLPIMDSMLPSLCFLPTSELYIDSRQAPELDYYLQGLDLQGHPRREAMQNRWILSLHSMMLNIIVELVESKSLEGNAQSLYNLAEQVKSGQRNREDLPRPQAEIAVALCELFNGLLQAVGNRNFDNALTAKLIPKLFWLTYFICKLRRGYNESDLVAICNQIPILWALTYQKVLEPMIKDCKLADTCYRDRKFSSRIKKICEFLDVSLTKPSLVEKNYYSKVLNSYASTSKLSEAIGREIDRFFTMLLSKYTARSKQIDGSENIEAQIISTMIWSNSRYSTTFFDILEKLLKLEIIERDSEEILVTMSTYQLQIQDDARKSLNEMSAEYNSQEDWLKANSSKAQYCGTNRRRNASDQFSPIWQSKLLQAKLATLTPFIENPALVLSSIQKLVKSVNGIILSPRCYSSIIKFLDAIAYRNSNPEEDVFKQAKESANMYSSYLVDHIVERVVLDNQIVGWTKLRVTTCDLPSQAPLLPEYSPVDTLVGSYCLDVDHLKLNAYTDSLSQLDSVIMYLWRTYVPNKLNTQKDLYDINLAESLMRYRIRTEARVELIGQHDEQALLDSNTSLVNLYIARRLPAFSETMKMIEQKLQGQDRAQMRTAVRMIYFGYLNYLEYAPIFTLDPALRCREKLEIYRAELAHARLDLHLRNTLFYYKTGENLMLNEIDPEDATLYPFSTRILVERRAKLEKSLKNLMQQNTNRPKCDDGSLYFELRKEVEVNVSRYTQSVNTLMSDLIGYIDCEKVKDKEVKFSNLITRCRMWIRSLERSILRFKSEYALYTDLTTNFLLGLCFVQQGLRCLYSRLEQRLQIRNLGFASSIEKFSTYLTRVYSFNNFTLGNLDSAARKFQFLENLPKLCPPDDVHQVKSIILKTILMQLNHHIIITPSDIRLCIPLVKNIADCFHKAWIERKNYLEEQRKQREDLYRYKTSRTTLGDDISFERQEFLEICSKFPTYDHIFYTKESTDTLTSVQKENLETEKKITNLNKSVDLSMCIDICKAHFKFMLEASCSLLNQSKSDCRTETPIIDLKQFLKYEAETIYTITRHCGLALNRSFDSSTVECHLLQAVELRKRLQETKGNSESQQRDLKSSINILDDDDVFDIYYSPNCPSALVLRDLINRLDETISKMRRNFEGCDSNPLLLDILKLTTRLSSFLITDPMMKFVTGTHALMDRIKSWNEQSIPREQKLTTEADELHDLLKAWRKVEVESWRNCLHHTRRKYIDATLCDLWFQLYEYFDRPVEFVRDLLNDQPIEVDTNLHTDIEEEVELSKDNEETLYQGFALLIKNFLEDSCLGDYQLRLDLVFSFILQSKFSGITQITKKEEEDSNLVIEELTVNYEKLTTYTYNIYRQYQGLFAPIKALVDKRETELLDELNKEIKIVSWIGRNLHSLKNNLRKSHMKLNKVTNKYLETLKSPLPGLRPDNISLELFKTDQPRELDSDRMKATLIAIGLVIDTVDSEMDCAGRFTSLQSVPRSVNKLKELYHTLNECALSDLTQDLTEIEVVVESNYEAMAGFHSHKVRDVVIRAQDSKEAKDAKYKLCRQMQHSKKFCLQSIFKSLLSLGCSYRRGYNSAHLIDKNILSVEPLRGMVQNKRKSVMDGISKLVEDGLVDSCNEGYRKLIANYMFLIMLPEHEDLDLDQKLRVKGYVTDIILDVIKHNKSSANLYRHLMDIQAMITRLDELRQKRSSNNGRAADGRVFKAYNFVEVHKTVRQFDELIGRAYLATLKLEELGSCCRTAIELATAEDSQNRLEQNDLKTMERNEREILRELILETDESNSLLTEKQLAHIDEHLPEIRISISDISNQLKDKLMNNIKNYVYSDDDLDELEKLYEKFIESFGRILPTNEGDPINFSPGTALHGIEQLLSEAKTSLRNNLNYLRDSNSYSDTDRQPWVDMVGARVQKLVRQLKLSIQSIYNGKQDPSSLIAQSETQKRNQMPFNKLDSICIARQMRLDTVAKCVGNFFLTLNRSNVELELNQLTVMLWPLLFVYSQIVASYLNVILSSLHLRLVSANQLVPFFTDLTINGFGLPYKVPDVGTDEKGASKPASSEDNAGFGEGQGDTDVSKKLEFESQLDELKKDEEQADKQEKNENEQDVEAHDDGVEMSTDIEAKANGPDQSNGHNEDDDGGDDENSDDESMNDLDKELDSVDQDEEKLDQNLWEDEDEPKLDHETEDLREAESDPTLKPKIEETQTMAKEGNLEPVEDEVQRETSKDPATKSEEDDQTNGTSPEKKTPQLESAEDANTEESPEEGRDETENEDLDLDDEAAQAAKQGDLVNDKETDQDKQDEIDMSLSEDEADNETKANGDDRDEGELSPLSQCSSEGLEEAMQSNYNDDEIDQQLEEVVEHPHDERLLSDPIEETIKNLSGNKSVEAISVEEQGPRELKGKQVGTFTVYNVLDEDYEEEDSSSSSAYVDAKQPSSHDESQSETSQQAKVDLKESGPSTGQNSAESEGISKQTPPESKEKSPTKRTHADLDEDRREMPKRQRILDAGDDQEQPSKEKPESITDKARHTGSAIKDAPEVIDILSSDDDSNGMEFLDTRSEEVDPKGETRLQAKGSGESEKIGPDSEIEDQQLESALASSHSGTVENKETEMDESREGEGNNDDQPSMGSDQLTPISSIDTSLFNDESIAPLDINFWHDCIRKVHHLEHELCQQLQMVLQPTKMSKYKGDYKSGKRLNMRKIISYIASQYRKDKIWLRRTKPSKRTYNITLAVDNSSSMSENNCRQMTFQSLALLAKSLSIIEAGSLSVVSFGESVQCIHDFDAPYDETTGAEWLNKLRFNENRTSYTKLLNYCLGAFEEQTRKRGRDSASNLPGSGSFSQLLVILSDGRNISSEEDDVKKCLRKLRSIGVLTLIVLIDDLKMNQKRSIVDIKRAVGSGTNIKMVSYMELFPFPFYVLLRQLNCMPSILGSALRQWFELVNAN